VILTAMDWWKPAPGTLMEWHPSAAAMSRARAAPADPGPLTFLQENHIRACHATVTGGAEHKAYLGTATEIDGDLDASALSRALRTYVLRHEGLRTWFRTDGAQISRMLVNSEAVDFKARTVGQFSDEAEFGRYIHARLGAEAIATRWPGFAFGAVSRPGSFTLYYACDHALSDGVSQALVLDEVAALYEAEVEGTTPPAHITAPTGSFRDYARMESDIANDLTVRSPEVAEWVDIFDAHGGTMPGFPLDMGLAPGETASVRPIEFPLLDAAGAERFDRVCKASGATVIAGIYAAVAITEFELAGRADYFGIAVLGTRMLDGFALSQGWFCNFAPVAFEVLGARSFTDLVSRAQDGHIRAKRLAAVPLPVVIGALLQSGAAPAEVTSTPNLLSYIDFRKFPGNGHPAFDRGVIFTGEGRTSNASMWFNRDHERLYLGLQTPDTPRAQVEVNRYLDHLREVINTVSREGDYSLSGNHVEELALARHHD
jgi:hypothetical protein